MNLIADSGSTKTSWHLLGGRPDGRTDCQTTGINPFYQHSSDIVKTLETEFTLDRSQIKSVFFYGAGATNETKKEELRLALTFFFHAEQIFIESDLMAASHALCGHSEGIAAILGTGSNSCYYDGKSIADHVSPLGYILGDEGSGAVLGRKLISDILKNQFPQSLTKLFFETYNTTPADIMEQVYRKPFPNRYLAGFTKYLSANIREEVVYQLVYNSFVEFFRRNISQYSRAKDLEIRFAGSIAFYFQNVLADAAHASGYKMGKILQDPMQGLIDYHNNEV